MVVSQRPCRGKGVRHGVRLDCVRFDCVRFDCVCADVCLCSFLALSRCCETGHALQFSITHTDNRTNVRETQEPLKRAPQSLTGP